MAPLAAVHTWACGAPSDGAAHMGHPPAVDLDDGWSKDVGGHPPAMDLDDSCNNIDGLHYGCSKDIGGLHDGSRSIGFMGSAGLMDGLSGLAIF